MTLRTIAVPQPAAGADWSYTVPGQYILDLRSITATLVSATNPVTSGDLSGSSPATYDPTAQGHITWGASGPFGAGSAAADINPPSLVRQAVAQAANGGTFDLANFTYEAYINPRDSGIGSFESILGMQQTASPFKVRDYLAIHRAPPNSSVGYFYAGNNVNTPGGNITDGAWHQIALTYDGTTWSVYKDGALGGTSTTGTPDTTVTAQPFDIAGNTASSSNIFNGAIGAAAVWGSVLSAAQIAAHYAGRISPSAYQTAVLADSPLAFWMFTQQVTHLQRTVTLEITDGTNVVASYPGFAPSQQSNVFNWTWLTDAGSTVQSVDQTTTVVAIPRMILPPGYVIRTRTVDLNALDQWSNVTIWWNDSLSPLPGGGTGFVYPPGAYLVYRKV